MKTQYEVLTEDPEFRKMVALEFLVLQASEVIARLMAEQGLSKADLARRLNKSRAWVTQLLNGQANMTIRTLAEVVHELDGEVVLHSQNPRWKSGASPKSSRPVVYRMDNYSFGQPRAANEVFRLNDVNLTYAGDETAPESEDAVRPGYAA
jgi:transcriptional regulator with XRE-family HTH domain